MGQSKFYSINQNFFLRRSVLVELLQGGLVLKVINFCKGENLQARTQVIK